MTDIEPRFPGEPDVRIDVAGMRMSPADMRQLTKATGRTMEQLMQSEESADKFQAMSFVILRRRHPDFDAGMLWELAGETPIEMSAEPADPFDNGPPTTLPSSVDTGE